MNKTKHEAQHVPEYSAERETNRLSLCRGGCSRCMMDKGASRAPSKRLAGSMEHVHLSQEMGLDTKNLLCIFEGI